MSRPKVSLENYKELYDFYESHDQNPIFARHIAHPILGKVFRPNISSDGDGEALEAIKDELGHNRRLIVSQVHLTDLDQFVTVSLAQRVKELRSLRGNTFIPTKSSISSGTSLVERLVRWGQTSLVRSLLFVLKISDDKELR